MRSVTADAAAQGALDVPETPAYVYSESLLKLAAGDAREIATRAGCRLLYTMKPCSLNGVLATLAPWVDGFAASSVFEVRLAGELVSSDMSLHCYSPAFSAADMATVASTVDYLSLNSAGQFQMAFDVRNRRASLGIRVNPETSFVADSRYDPCRRHSKLGVPLSGFSRHFESVGVADQIEGIHIHANCESDDLGELTRSAEALREATRGLPRLTWVNLGGGYYLDSETDIEPLLSVMAWLKAELDATVFIEPGTSLVQRAGMLVTEVLDVFESGGADIAVLDASTSHMPEVFEYGFTPAVHGVSVGGDRLTVLGGKSCLAGDVFGQYMVRERLRPGQRLAVLDAGAYSHARAAAFNGIPIPSSFLMRADGSFIGMSSFGYGDFAVQNGVAAVAPT